MDKEACLKAHNDKRAIHGAKPLIWDGTLEQHAQKWADHLASTGSLVHASGTGEGENLYYGSGSRTCASAMAGWYVTLFSVFLSVFSFLFFFFFWGGGGIYFCSDKVNHR